MSTQDIRATQRSHQPLVAVTQERSPPGVAVGFSSFDRRADQLPPNVPYLGGTLFGWSKLPRYSVWHRATPFQRLKTIPISVSIS
eukprot:7329196-Prymnesium_polylepis.1